MVLYGLMILNVLTVAGFLLWAWRRGHFKNLDRASDLLFEGQDADEEGCHEHERKSCQ